MHFPLLPAKVSHSGMKKNEAKMGRGNDWKDSVSWKEAIKYKVLFASIWSLSNVKGHLAENIYAKKQLLKESGLPD